MGWRTLHPTDTGRRALQRPGRERTGVNATSVPAPPAASSSPRPALWKPRGGMSAAPQPLRGCHAPGGARGTKAAASSRPHPGLVERAPFPVLPDAPAGRRGNRDGYLPGASSAGPVRDPGAPSSEFWGLEPADQEAGSAGRTRTPLPASRRGRCLYLRGAEARVRSAGRGRGRREGALTAAGPVGTPPASSPGNLGRGRRGRRGRRAAGAATRREPEPGVLMLGRFCTRLRRFVV